jgi:hypothetical protein
MLGPLTRQSGREFSGEHESARSRLTRYDLLGHAVLNFGRAAYGIHYTCELREQAIACRFDNPTTMLANFGVNKLLPVGLKLGKGAFLVDPHEPTVPDHVRRQDRS